MSSATHGFELLRQERIAEYDIDARLYRHLKTGAQVLSLVCNDENKVFGISFRTPPSDSTGVAHILEHSVLCGSRKYPVKEPFVELLKGSLQTFLNAFTYPDKTCYPVASVNLQDFYNLVDVYLDAVFYPRLNEHIFAQEGWHYDLDSPDKPMTFKGVVFNEMKGAYSSPESVLAERSQQSLFPDTTYGLDSGGDPKKIPDLTFEQFMDFHRSYYHPSNARAFFYGDDDPDRRLAILDEYFREFEAAGVASEVGLQRHFDGPKRIEAAYAAGQETLEAGDEEEQGEERGGKIMVTVNWLLPESTDVAMAYELDVLDFILIGMAGSPLRKALIDSGLGEDLAGGGLESEIRQMYFSTGLKGVAAGNEDKVETLIMDTLAALARDGIAPDMVEAAININEFGLRENNTGSFPRGLSLMLRSLTSWLYDGDPFEPMRFQDCFNRLKERIGSGEKIFEEMIRRHFLDSPHRTTVILRPDPELAAKTERQEAERLEAVKQSLSDEACRRIAEETAFLREFQARPDSPEDLATIPTLSVDDLPRENPFIPLEERDLAGVRTLYHDLPTNGILYLDLGFDLHVLPRELLHLLPLFGRALLETGTTKEDYVSFLQRIARKTGGVRRETLTSSLRARSGSAAWMFLRGKAITDNATELLAILRDALTDARLEDRERFRQMLLESKARQEQRIVPSGHHIVNTRLRARFSEADGLAEEMHGVTSLFRLRELVDLVDKDWDRVREGLFTIRNLLLQKDAMIVNVTLDRAAYDALEPELERFVDGLPINRVDRAVWDQPSLPAREGLTIPAQVNYVGKGANIYKAGYNFHGSALVIARYLRTAWLWDKVRVQGGAYGAFCSFDRLSGVLSFVSYRDPNVTNTLKIYDETADFLRTRTIDGDELGKSIVGAIGDLDSYMLPDAKGFVSMARYLWGESDIDRQRLRDDVLGTTPAHFRDFAEAVEVVARQGDVVVLGQGEALSAASAAMGGKGLSLTRVL